MIKATKFRLYPTIEQAIFFDRTFGCCRKLYNEMLAERKEVYERLKDNRSALYSYKYRTVKEIKQEFPFMDEIDSQALGRVENHLLSAYSNFFRSLKGQRKNKSIGFPKFHKRGIKDAYTARSPAIKLYSNSIKLPKCGLVKANGVKILVGCIKYATISKRAGKYFCSVCFDTNEIIPAQVKIDNNSKIVGLDMSLTNFFVDSDGQSPAYERLFRSNEKRLARLQKIESRRLKNSRRCAKIRKSIATTFYKISCKRQDFTHKLSSQLVKDNDVIVIESLNMQDMSRALRLGKSVSDLGWGMFVNQLRYKCNWQGKHLIEADKWFASSKICNKCGYKYSDLKLSDRKWTCPNCHTQIDRDFNAAKNLASMGIESLGRTGRSLMQSEVLSVDKPMKIVA